MDRTERFYKIERLLRSRGCVNFEALLEELGVSPATLKRDLQYLRDRMGAPITYDHDDKGYRLDASGAMASGAAKTVQHELPGMWFSERELHALLTMHQLMSGLDDDGVLARHLQPMMDRLQGLLGADANEARELVRRVKLIGTARRRVPSRHFELLGSALVQRKRVWLNYFKRNGRTSSEREVSPQRLVNYRNTWYLDAWCHASDGLRRFALDAVIEARPLDTRAKPVALKDIYETAGVRTTGHSALKQDYVPVIDAETVRRLKDAGSVILGKLGTHEFANGAMTPDQAQAEIKSLRADAAWIRSWQDGDVQKAAHLKKLNAFAYPSAA